MFQSIGQTIKKLRKEKNLTQEELAELLNVTSQAVSKWENETGMPDISQILPLVSVFGVSTDVLFGVEGTTADEEAVKIIEKANAMIEYGKVQTYLNAYDELIEGLKKYPGNLILLSNCMELGLSLSLPENGWLYAAERARAKVISAETIRQAKLIISYSKNISENMRARQVLVLLYSSEGRFDKAVSEAQNFRHRPDFTFYANLATVNEYLGQYDHVAACLCSEIDYDLQNLEDCIARLGKAYCNNGKYCDAISVYETYFTLMNSIFKDGIFPPYHDFDSGDCYILLALAYIATGEADKAIDNIEKSVMYYLRLSETYKNDIISGQVLKKSSIVKESEINTYICKSTLKERLKINCQHQNSSCLKIINVIKNYAKR